MVFHGFHGYISHNQRVSSHFSRDLIHIFASPQDAKIKSLETALERQRQKARTESHGLMVPQTWGDLPSGDVKIAKMVIEIVDLANLKMVMFHSYGTVYQRVYVV